MNLVELKEAVDTAIENAIEGFYVPEEVKVSLQIDTFGKSDVSCSTSVEAHFDCDLNASGFVLVGSNGYEP